MQLLERTIYILDRLTFNQQMRLLIVCSWVSQTVGYAGISGQEGSWATARRFYGTFSVSVSWAVSPLAGW